MKLKKNVKVILFIVLLTVVTLTAIIVIRNSSNNTGSQAEMIQDGGNLEIQIPEDQDTGGF